MKCIIAGGRHLTNKDIVYQAIEDSGFEDRITTVVSGGASGVDTLGEEWANEHNIPVLRFPANWKKYGKRAGFERNCEMGEVGELLIAVWDGKSPGTKMMIDIAEAKGLDVFIYPYITVERFND